MRSCRDGFPSFLLVGFDDVGNLVEVIQTHSPNPEKETKIFPLSFIYFIFISRVHVRITDVDAKSNRSKDSVKVLEAHVCRREEEEIEVCLEQRVCSAGVLFFWGEGQYMCYSTRHEAFQHYLSNNPHLLDRMKRSRHY